MKGNYVIDNLIREKQILTRIIKDANDEISGYPNGVVHVKKHKNSVQFYLKEESENNRIRYMLSSERKKAVAIVQKQYLIHLKSAAEKQLKIIDSFLAGYDPDSLKNVFKRESEARQRFLRPVVVPDDLYAEVWQKAQYKPKEFFDGTPVHYTLKNERVRSKSEVMIANCLARAGIPYRYECPLKLGNKIIHPDFTILRMSDRKEIYWEHLGMIDDTEYRNNAFLRIRDYESNDIFPGDRLILTAETYKIPLNTAVIEQHINHFFFSVD